MCILSGSPYLTRFPVWSPEWKHSFRALRLLRVPFVDHRQHHHTNKIPVHRFQGCSMQCQAPQLIYQLWLALVVKQSCMVRLFNSLRHFFNHSRITAGSYCILFIISWIVLGQKQRSPNLSSPVVFANFLLFFCCTAHFALEFNHFYKTLVGFPIRSLENTYPHPNFSG